MTGTSVQQAGGRLRAGNTPERSGQRSEEAAQKNGRGGSRSATKWIGWQIVGFGLLGAGLMVIADRATEGSQYYTSTPQFKVWAALMIGLIASLPVVWRVGLDLLRRLSPNPWSLLRAQALRVLAGVVLVVGVAELSGVWARGSGSALYGDRVHIGVVYLLAVMATAPAFLTMWECYRQLDEKSGDTGITQLLLLRECLLSSFTTVGLLVSAGVLATGAQRQAALAAPKYAAPYPSAYVLIWCLAFSAILLVIFTPVFRRLTRRANIIIDTTLPILTPGSGRWQDRLQERQDLASLLQVTGSAKDVITSAVLVAGPLISSAFSLFLPSSLG